ATPAGCTFSSTEWTSLGPENAEVLRAEATAVFGLPDLSLSVPRYTPADTSAATTAPTSAPSSVWRIPAPRPAAGAGETGGVSQAPDGGVAAAHAGGVGAAVPVAVGQAALGTSPSPGVAGSSEVSPVGGVTAWGAVGSAVGSVVDSFAGGPASLLVGLPGWASADGAGCRHRAGRRRCWGGRPGGGRRPGPGVATGRPGAPRRPRRRARSPAPSVSDPGPRSLPAERHRSVATAHGRARRDPRLMLHQDARTPYAAHRFHHAPEDQLRRQGTIR